MNLVALDTARSGPPPPTIVPALQLLRDFKPIEAIVDGLPVGRGALVAVTAPTGHGKTTVTTLLHASLCRGLTFAAREVTRGSVLVLAGENPDDYTMHLAATAQDLSLDGADLSRPRPMGSLLVVPGTFEIDYELEYLKGELARFGTDLVSVFVDTSAAFYTGADENDNVATRQHASSLRELTTLPGKPTVFVLCHPTKNAQRENLLPRGGGSFLAEVDANLTLWKDDSGIVTLHWAGKIRGPNFDPIRFELVPVELEGFKDCRGKPIWSVVARHLPDDRAEQMQAKAMSDDDILLMAMQAKRNGSLADLAKHCGWTNGAMQPMKARVFRRLKFLQEKGLVEQDRKDKWRLTPKGEKEADSL